MCKLSGLAMPFGSMRVDTLEPWITYAIAAFGVDRCLFASNFPVDAVHGTFDELYTTFSDITAGLTTPPGRSSSPRTPNASIASDRPARPRSGTPAADRTATVTPVQRSTAPNASPPPRCTGSAAHRPRGRSASGRASRNGAGRPGSASRPRCPGPGRRRRGGPLQAAPPPPAAAARPLRRRMRVIDHEGQVDVRGGVAAHGTGGGHATRRSRYVEEDVEIELEPADPTGAGPPVDPGWLRPNAMATAGSISPTAPRTAAGVTRCAARVG